MKLFAYLDPGTGTVIVQAILGGAAGVAVLFKTMGKRLPWRKDPEATPEPTDEAEEPTMPTQSTD